MWEHKYKKDAYGRLHYSRRIDGGCMTHAKEVEIECRLKMNYPVRIRATELQALFNAFCEKHDVPKKNRSCSIIILKEQKQ